jgi:hypothetical protein
VNVTDYAMEVAILRILRDFRIFEPGASLLLTDLQAAWPRTGLRTRDIEAGLDKLRADECVTLRTTASGESVITLLPRGAERLTALPGALSQVMDEMVAALILRSARGRRRRTSPVLRPRRKDDPIEVPQLEPGQASTGFHQRGSSARTEGRA